MLYNDAIKHAAYLVSYCRQPGCIPFVCVFVCFLAIAAPGVVELSIILCEMENPLLRSRATIGSRKCFMVR